ncbi:unnamed protein product [Caenorhabditis sp. 36 PRJEB53466]|nr:unnamed protein product [Caenorhabditis sp. 36 PRJEB53466]
MPHCRRALVLLLLLTVIINFGTHALKCRLYHRIWEDGHLLRINPDICHTSSKYCVRATYADPDDRKKNGYSMGCDKVDCQGIDNPNYTGWQQKENGEYCRKSRDYGKLTRQKTDAVRPDTILEGYNRHFAKATRHNKSVVPRICLNSMNDQRHEQQRLRTDTIDRCNTLIHEFLAADGASDANEILGETLERNKIRKCPYECPGLLKQIIDDIRAGEIESTLDYVEITHPLDETELRINARIQMVTDNIELEQYGTAVRQLRKFKSPCVDEPEKTKLLIGALLVGRLSMYDHRYKDLFDYTTKENIATTVQTLFIPPSPLKPLMRVGLQGLYNFARSEAFLKSSCYTERELPLEVSYDSSHSSFTCPILKEQCSLENPPMRLVCGHVICKEAITRLTTSLRQMRSSSRHARFKCPYCPREQYMDSAKKVDFTTWHEDDDDDYEMDTLLISFGSL